MREKNGGNPYHFVTFFKRLGWWNIWLLVIALGISFLILRLDGNLYQWLITPILFYWFLLSIAVIGYRVALSWFISWALERLEPIEAGLRELEPSLSRMHESLDEIIEEIDDGNTKVEMQTSQRLLLLENFVADLRQDITEIKNGHAAKAIKQPQEHPDKAAKKDKILAHWKQGYNLTEIASKTGIPYSTLKVYRDELINEGKLPREAKKSKGGLGPDSI